VILRLVAAAAVALLLAGCGAFSAPSPTAGEMGDLVAGLVRRGATITEQVGGDAGCPDANLYGNAVRYDLRGPGEVDTVPIYLLRWKSDATFTATQTDFDACVESFKKAHPGTTITRYEDAPWRAYGPDWSTTVQTLVETAVHEAAGASAPAEPQ
jgi:hypothetical protein